MRPEDVQDNKEGQRFELHIGSETAFIQYQAMHGVLVLTHTEVPATLEGMGVGSALAEGSLRLLADRGLEVIPICPFVHEYIQQHPVHADLVSAKYKRRGDLTAE